MRLLSQEQDRRNVIEAKAATSFTIVSTLAPLSAALIGVVSTVRQCPLWGFVLVVVSTVLAMAAALLCARFSRLCYFASPAQNQENPNYLWESATPPANPVRRDLAESAWRAFLIMAETNNEKYDLMYWAQFYGWTSLAFYLVAGLVLLFTWASRMPA